MSLVLSVVKDGQSAQCRAPAKKTDGTARGNKRTGTEVEKGVEILYTSLEIRIQLLAVDMLLRPVD